jgi:protein-S-isoprenylcysteine O-methyltransferase Ste14
VRTLVMALAVVAFEASLLALALGGFGALLLHRRAVALVLVWAAGAAVLGVLRPVRAQDPAERAPRRGLLLVALLVIPLVTPMLCAWAERAGLAPLPGGAALRWSGVALAAAGLALRIAAMVRLGDRFAPVVALQREHALETRGPYATLRHPGYVGSWLANLGAALAFGSAAGLVSPVLFAVALEARMREEEAQLERRFGDAWRAYAARAGRWAPHA